MKRTLHTIILLGCISLSYGQAPNDEYINATEVNGTATLTTDALNGTTSTDPLFDDAGCITGDDVFYKHIVVSNSPADESNQTTIEVVFPVTALGVSVNFQIFKVPAGQETNRTKWELLSCDSFTSSVITAAQTFTNIYSDINVGDTFYFRLYKPSGSLLPGILDTLLGNTVLTMSSTRNETLSLNSFETSELKHIVKENSILLFNNHNLNNYKIYGLDGKMIANKKSLQPLENINISLLRKGIYILILDDNKAHKPIKFIKK